MSEKATLGDQFINYTRYMTQVHKDRGDIGVMEVKRNVLTKALLEGEHGVAPLHIILDMCGIYDGKLAANLSDREFAMEAARRRIGYEILEMLKVF